MSRVDQLSYRALYLFGNKIFNLEVIGDSHAVVRKDAERSLHPFPGPACSYNAMSQLPCCPTVKIQDSSWTFFVGDISRSWTRWGKAFHWLLPPNNNETPPEDWKANSQGTWGIDEKQPRCELWDFFSCPLNSPAWVLEMSAAQERWYPSPRNKLVLCSPRA